MRKFATLCWPFWKMINIVIAAGGGRQTKRGTAQHVYTHDLVAEQLDSPIERAVGETGVLQYRGKRRRRHPVGENSKEHDPKQRGVDTNPQNVAAEDICQCPPGCERPEMPEGRPQQQHWLRGRVNDLHRAASDGSIQRTVALLSRGSPDINQGTPDGYTPLMISAGRGHSNIVRILLNKGADVSIVKADGLTALHVSASGGELATTILLVEAGADLHATGCNGGTPLHYATEHLEVTMALVKAGADIQATDFEGTTALHLAAGDGHLEVTMALVQAGADLKATTSQGFTPLHVAAGDGHPEVAIALTKAGANLNATAFGGLTPLQLAVDNGHLEVTKALMQAGADLEATASHDITALHIAAKNRHLDVMTALVKAGADLQATTSEGDTPLRLAAREGHAEMVKALIDARRPCFLGPTFLARAIDSGRCSPRVVRLLVDAGADASPAQVARTPVGWGHFETPLDITNRRLRTEKAEGIDATEEQLHRLEGIRRLLLRVEAVHAVSWLWCNDISTIGRAPQNSTGGEIASTPLSAMLPALRRRARRGVLLRALFRLSSKSAGEGIGTGGCACCSQAK